MTGGRSSASTTSAFIAVTTLFFAWGFITSLVDPLVAAVKGIFTLSNVEAQASASAFFFAYFVMSFPGAWLVSKLKPVPSIILALITMIAGCLIMLVAVNLAVYPLVLLGLFVLASGITVLQVAANPLAAALGDPAKSHFRLTLSQTFNSFGTFLGPLLGAHLFLKGVEVKHGTVVTDAVRHDALAGIDTAYFWIGGMIAALALFFWVRRSVVNSAIPAGSGASQRGVGELLHSAFFSPSGIAGLVALIAYIAAGLTNQLSGDVALYAGMIIALYLFTLVGLRLESKWALLGGYAIFLYVGAEVSIGTQMALFLNDNATWGLSDAPFRVPLLGWAMQSDGVPGVSLQEAGRAVAFYWGGAMVGRAVGSVLLARFNAARLLAVFTAIAAAMCLYVVVVGGVTAGFVALAIGLFNSIMFPVIFTLTLERSSASEEATSGLLCTAIVGGAVLPLVVGKISDATTYSTALIVPAVCYVILMLFAIRAGSAKVARAEGEPAVVSMH